MGEEQHCCDCDTYSEEDLEWFRHQNKKMDDELIEWWIEELKRQGKLPQDYVNKRKK